MLKSAGLESGSPKPQEQEEEPPQGLKRFKALVGFKPEFEK